MAKDIMDAQQALTALYRARDLRVNATHREVHAAIRAAVLYARTKCDQCWSIIIERGEYSHAAGLVRMGCPLDHECPINSNDNAKTYLHDILGHIQVLELEDADVEGLSRFDGSDGEWILDIVMYTVTSESN